MFKNFDLGSLKKNPEIAFYFRYRLHHSDFHELRENGRLKGYVAAKPLYGRLTPEGKVDKAAGFNGQIAVVFIQSPARSERQARLIITEISRAEITTSTGKRNWPRIRAAADRAVVEELSA